MFEQELAAALSVAEKAGALQMRHFCKMLSVTTKEDSSPVTEVDKKCEDLIVTALLQQFPNDSFLGEESGKKDGSSGRCWIIDPLDGTRPYLRGIPTFSTLIALEENNTPVLGVIHLPALGKTCWAAQGTGAFSNGKPIHVSTTQQLDHAIGSALGFLEHPDSVLREKLLTAISNLDYHYGFMDAFSYVCLAEGKLDLCINLLDKAWDCAAAACIVTEAGGLYSDITATPTVHNGSIVLSNGILHKQILKFFTSCRFPQCH